jgi:hypothetical protein
VSKNKEVRLDALVGGVDEDGSLAQQVRVLLQDDVGHRQHQRVPGWIMRRHREPGLSGRTRPS